MLELAAKAIRQLTTSAGSLVMVLSKKYGGLANIKAANSLFLGLLMRDWLEKKLVICEPDAAGGERVVAQAASAATALYLAPIVQKTYDDIKARFDKALLPSSKHFPSAAKSSNAKSKPKNNLLTIGSQDITIIHKLGSGSNGVSVFMAQWRQKYCAVKTIDTNTPEEIQALFAEADLNSLIPLHPNVLRTFGISIQGSVSSIHPSRFCSHFRLQWKVFLDNGVGAERIASVCS